MSARDQSVAPLQTQPVIMLHNSKGGVGKTANACLFAAMFRLRGIEYVMIDADLSGGDLKRRHPNEAELVGFLPKSIARVLEILDRGLPTIIDFGASTEKVAAPMIDKVVASAKNRPTRTPVLFAPFDDSLKSKLYLVELMDRYPDALVVGAAKANADTEVPVAPRRVSNVVVVPHISGRLIKNYEKAGDAYGSFVKLMALGAGDPAYHMPAAMAARSYVRQFEAALGGLHAQLFPSPITTVLHTQPADTP